MTVRSTPMRDQHVGAYSFRLLSELTSELFRDENKMKRVLLFTLLLAVQSLTAQDWARAKLEKSPRHREWVRIKHDNRSVETFVAYPASNGTLFVTGYCWGGGQSFRFATNRNDLKAAFVFYGPPPDKDAMKRINAPVYGFYGGNDSRIDATIPQAKENMAAAGKTYVPVTYDGAGHGFMRAGEAPDASEGNKKAHDDAWARWKTLLAK